MEAWHWMWTGVVLQTSPLVDLLPEGLQHCRPSPRKICNIAELHPRGRVCNIADLPPFLADLPRGRSATLQTFPHFCKVPDSYFRMYRKRVLNHNKRLYMQYVRLNYKIIIFSDVNDLYFSVKLRQLIWLYNTGKTYNGWNGMGEDLQWGKVRLQWFFSTIVQIFRGVCNGGREVCNITPALYMVPKV